MKRLWNSSLVTKVFLSYLAVIALLFLGLYYSSNALLRNFYIDSLSARIPVFSICAASEPTCG